jgi:hypothetical protein
MTYVDIDAETLKKMCEATVKDLLERQEFLDKQLAVREAKEEAYVAAHWWRKYMRGYDPWANLDLGLRQDRINDAIYAVNKIQAGLKLHTGGPVRISVDELAALKHV